MNSSEPSPLSARGLWDLYFSPRSFFARWNLKSRPAILIAVWIMGMAAVLHRIDRADLAKDFGIEVGPSLAAANSWPVLWFAVIVFGVLNGWLTWLIGGWWYRIRLELSGASQPDSRLARAVYTYQSLIEDLPNVLLAVLATFGFASYAQAQDSDELWLHLPPVMFLIWSIVASYQGVRTVYADVSKRKAVFWFIVAPIAFYIVLLVVLTILAVIYIPDLS